MPGFSPFCKWPVTCMSSGMSAAISSSKTAGLAAWLESPASLPPPASPRAEAARAFTSALHEAAREAGAGQTGQTVSGLARVFCPGHLQALGPELADALCPFGTGIPEQNEAESTPDTSSGTEAQADLSGVFRDVPEDSVEPFNAILFWRRPDSPPPVAQSSKRALAEALREAGYDPKGFAVSYWETKGEWPGGMMVVPQLTVIAPNGRKADLSPELIVRSPRSAVEDIRRLMEMPESEASAVSTA